MLARDSARWPIITFPTWYFTSGRPALPNWASTSTTRSWRTTAARALRRRSPLCGDTREIRRISLGRPGREHQGDLAIIRDNIRGNLLELETIRVGRRIPTPIRGDHEQRVRADGARFCACGRAAAVVDCAREADAGGFDGARQNLKILLDLYGNCAGAIAGIHRLFPA